jgi:hypothetical protein
MATPTLEDIVSGAQQFIRSSQEASKAQQENTAAIVKKTQELSQVYQTVASDAAVVRATTEAAQLKVQSQNAQIARAAGIDPEAGANVLVETVTKLRQSNVETEANLKEYRRKNEQGFMDFIQNPIGVIVDQITLPQTEEKLKGSVQQAALYSEQLNTVNKTLQNSFQTTEQLKESTTAASAEAQTRIAAASALINAQQTSIESLKYNAQGIRDAQDANKDQLNALYTAYNAGKSAEQLQMAKQSQALDLERFEWQKRERAEALAAKQEGKELDAMLAEKINAGRASLGMAQMSPTEIKSAVTLLKSGASKDISAYYEIGDRVVSSGGQAFVGSSPAESVRVMSTLPTNLPDIRKETAGILQEAMSALAANKTVDRKDQKAVDQFINSRVKETVQIQYSSIIPNAQNPFDVGDLSSYFGLSAINTLPVVTKFLGPLAQSGQPLNDPKLVLGFMADAMKKGTLTTSEISGLATVYQKANLINQQARGFASFGIIPPGLNNKRPGMNYMAKVQNYGKPVDMADPVEIQRYLSRKASEEAIQQLGIGMDPSGANAFRMR